MRRRVWRSITAVTFAAFLALTALPVGASGTTTTETSEATESISESDRIYRDTETHEKYESSCDVVLIADSYGGKPTAEEAWPELVGQGLGRPYSYLSKMGAGMCNGMFERELGDVAEKVDAQNVKLVVIGGGANDWGGSQDVIKTATEGVLSTAKAAYPNAKIYLAEFGGDCETASVQEGIEKNVIPAYRDAAAAEEVEYITDAETALSSADLFGDDGLHPNEEGSIKIADALVKALNSDAADSSASKMSATDSEVEQTDGDSSAEENGDASFATGFILVLLGMVIFGFILILVTVKRRHR